jgi:hypothetical protein
VKILVGLFAFSVLAVFVLGAAILWGEERTGGAVGVVEDAPEAGGLRAEEMFLSTRVGASVRAPELHGAKFECSLRIVSVEDHRGIEGVVVEAIGAPESLGRLDADGHAVVTCRPEEVLMVSAPGFAPRRILAASTVEPRVVELYPSAALVVHVVGAHGEPLAGELVEVVPVDRDGIPLDRGGLDGGAWRGRSVAAWSRPLRHPTGALVVPGSEEERLDVLLECAPREGWAQRTDENGEAIWASLPALYGYAWGGLSTELVRVEPPAPTGSTAVGDGTLAVSLDADAMSSHSGVFGLPVHGVVRLSGRSGGVASVMGVIPSVSSPPPGGVVVKLFHVSSEAKTQAQGYESVTYEASVVTDGGGDFTFLDAKAGTKELRAWWREAGNQYYFVHRRFALAPSEGRDLGIVYPLAGSMLGLEVGLVDEAGHPLSLDCIPGLSEPAELEIAFDTADSAIPAEEVLSVFAVMPWGEHVVFHGWPFGRASFDVRSIFTDHEPLSRGVRLEFPRGIPVEVGGELEFHTDVVLSRSVPLDVRARFPSEAEIQWGTLHVIEKETGKYSSYSLSPQGSALVEEISLRPGTYEYCFVVQASSRDPQGRSFEKRGEFTASLESSLVLNVDLDRAADVEGVLSAGARAKGALVQLETAPFLALQCSFMATEVDAQGHFRFGGLTPGFEYTVIWPEGAERRRRTFVAGGAGSVRGLGEL